MYFPSFTRVKFHAEINIIFRFAGNNEALKSKYCNSISLVSSHSGGEVVGASECRKVCGLNNIFVINWFYLVILGCCFPEQAVYCQNMLAPYMQ